MKFKIFKERMLLSIYAGFGFSFIAFMVTLINPIIYDKIQEARSIYENFEPRQIPPPQLSHFVPSGAYYPWGYYACLFGLGAALIILFAPCLLSLLRRQDSPLTRCIYSVVISVLIGGVTMVNFGFDAAYFVWIVAFGLAVGIIDGVRRSKIDVSYIGNQDMPTSVKLQALQSEYDKWFRGLTIFTAFLIAVGVSGTLQSAVNTPTLVWNDVALLYSSILVYVGIGLGIGLYWEVIRRVNFVTEQIRTIR